MPGVPREGGGDGVVLGADGDVGGGGASGVCVAGRAARDAGQRVRGVVTVATSGKVKLVDYTIQCHDEVRENGG